MSGVWLRRVALGLLLAVLAVTAVTARAVLDGERHMQASDAAFDQGDLPRAVWHARRAAVAYAPGAPHVDRAYARLLAVAVGSEASGRREDATLAWRAIRTAALETRHFTTPRAADRERADRALARLAVPPPDLGPGSPLLAPDTRPPGIDADAVAARHAELRRDDAPTTLGSLGLVLGFALAVGGLALTALRGVSEEGSLRWRGAALGGALTLVGLALWVVSVLRA